MTTKVALKEITHEGFRAFIYPEKNDVAVAAAEVFLSICKEAIEKRGFASVALSGGSTPQALYQVLSAEPFRSQVPWDKIHFFVSDERCVEEASEESNFGNARRQLFSQVGCPEANLYPVRYQEEDAYKAAADYEDRIWDFFADRDMAMPHFDLIFLGIGSDGHCASLFPDTEAVNETSIFVVDNYVPQLEVDRVTFTFPLLKLAEHVIFMVAGSDKQAVARAVLENKDNAKYPCQKVAPQTGRLLWLIDTAAAGE